jgi:hypothetical protein
MPTRPKQPPSAATRAYEARSTCTAGLSVPDRTADSDLQPGLPSTDPTMVTASPRRGQSAT